MCACLQYPLSLSLSPTHFPPCVLTHSSDTVETEFVRHRYCISLSGSSYSSSSSRRCKGIVTNEFVVQISCTHLGMEWGGGADENDDVPLK